MRDLNGKRLPRFQCHKQVYALKIKEVTAREGILLLIPEDTQYSGFAITKDFADRHQPHAGGYLVIYDNGHQSFSPAQAFEEGYTELTPEPKVELSESADTATVPRSLLKRLTKWLYCMSYNDSYFGESPGELKRLTAELDRRVD